MYTWPLTHTYAYLHFLAQQRVRLPSSKSISVLNSRWIFHPTVVTTAFTDIPDERKRSMYIPQGRRIRRRRISQRDFHYRILYKSVHFLLLRSITFKNLVESGVYHHNICSKYTCQISRFALISWLHYQWQQLNLFISYYIKLYVHSLTKFFLKL